jgi:hypothetical protein
MTLSTATLSVLEFLEGLRRQRDASIEQTCDNQRDDGLSISHAIMRGGPGSELSPPAGAASAPHGAKT